MLPAIKHSTFIKTTPEHVLKRSHLPRDGMHGLQKARRLIQDLAASLFCAGKIGDPHEISLRRS